MLSFVPFKIHSLVTWYTILKRINREILYTHKVWCIVLIWAWNYVLSRFKLLAYRLHSFKHKCHRPPVKIPPIGTVGVEVLSSKIASCLNLKKGEI